MSDFVPAGWEICRLGKLFDLQKGSINPYDFPDEVFEYYSIPEWDNNKSATNELGKLIESNKTFLPNPTILVSKLNPRKPRVILANNNSKKRKCASTEFMPYIPTNENINLPFYALYFLSRLFHSRLQQVATGSTNSHVRVSPSETLRWEIPFPPLPEQKAIAEALSDTDALIESLEQLIAKKRQIKQGAMQELLTGKKRLPGFQVKPGYKQTEVGVIPEDWKERSLNSFASVVSGKRLPLGRTLTDHETPHPYIRVTDMAQGTVALADLKFVPVDVFPAIRRYRIFKEDIFISVAGTLGIIGSIPAELDGANLTENADRITNIKCSKDYLLYFMMSPVIQNQIKSLQTLGAQPKLALTRIRKFAIPLPPTRAEQEAIAGALSDMDTGIASLETKLAKTYKLKQGMMQELLTGRIRLI